MSRLVIALALVAAACGGSAATTPDPSGDTVAAATSSADSTSDGDSTSSAESTDRVRPDGPDAPDFSLALGQGGSFTLSQEQKPVYMVFWAE